MRIVIVHPKRVIRSLAAQILAANGLEPIEAETLKDVMEVMDSAPPALAIVDEDFAEYFRTVPVPVIALGHAGARAALVAAGACCVVDKPFHVEDLVRAVRWVLEVYPPAKP